MASREAETMDADEATIMRGTGNVFADLGYPDAEERQTKLRLAHAINGVIARRRLTQAGGRGEVGCQPAEGIRARQLQARWLLGRAADDVPYGPGPGRRDRHPPQAAVAGKCADRCEPDLGFVRKLIEYGVAEIASSLMPKPLRTNHQRDL